MLSPKYSAGQRVKIILLVDGFGRPEPRVREWVGNTGEVVRSYYVSGDEVWEKTLRFVDTYCYDIRLDEGGDTARGIPEIGIEPFIHR